MAILWLYYGHAYLGPHEVEVSRHHGECMRGSGYDALEAAQRRRHLHRVAEWGAWGCRVGHIGLQTGAHRVAGQRGRPPSSRPRRRRSRPKRASHRPRRRHRHRRRHHRRRRRRQRSPPQPRAATLPLGRPLGLSHRCTQRRARATRAKAARGRARQGRSPQPPPPACACACRVHAARPPRPWSVRAPPAGRASVDVGSPACAAHRSRVPTAPASPRHPARTITCTCTYTCNMHMHMQHAHAHACNMHMHTHTHTHLLMHVRTHSMHVHTHSMHVYVHTHAHAPGL